MNRTARIAPRPNPAATIFSDFERVDPAVIERARSLSTATLHEAAGKVGALPSAIKPVHPHFRICGPAVPVHSPGGDNLWLHRALYVAKPGDVLVIHVNAQYEHGYWGEVMSTAASCLNLGGMIIDGCVRDCDLLAEVGFPVFARGLCIRGTGKDFAARGWVNAPTLFGDVVVKAGDLVLGDTDGVVVIPREQAAAAVDASFKRDALEADICKRLAGGERTLDIYGWS